jgi:hypothetical protein
MINENIVNDEDFIKINKEIDEIGKTFDVWYLKYYFNRLQGKYDILIINRDVEIKNLKDRIIELEAQQIKDITNTEKVNINLKYHSSRRIVTLSSNSKKHTPIFDECGRKWFIPKLNDESYIKIRFIGKNLDDAGKDENTLTLITGISSSSAIIGNTVFGKGKFKDVKNNFILDKRALSLLLIDSSIWFYVLRGTEKIEIIESSNDIVATLEDNFRNIHPIE